MGIEPRLEQEQRGPLIDPRLVFGARPRPLPPATLAPARGPAFFAQGAFGEGAGQAFVPRLDRDVRPEPCGERCDERHDAPGSLAGATRQLERQADDDARNLVFGDSKGDRIGRRVRGAAGGVGGTAREGREMDWKQGLRGETELVGARESKSSFAPIHRENPAHQTEPAARQAALWLPFLPAERSTLTRRTVVPSGPKAKSTESMHERIM